MGGFNRLNEVELEGEKLESINWSHTSVERRGGREGGREGEWLEEYCLESVGVKMVLTHDGGGCGRSRLLYAHLWYAYPTYLLLRNLIFFFLYFKNVSVNLFKTCNL